MTSSSPIPNLFIIGAKKSATTYLHNVLNEHPQVYMCNPKEPCYFVDPKELKRIWPDMWRKGYWKSERAYLNLFKNAGDCLLIGESSAEYTNYPALTGIPERIKRFNDRAKLIYIMRDPIKRWISHYWMHVHYYGKTINPLNAVEEIPEILDVSYYAMQLKRYMEVFDRQQIFAMTYEELIRSPKDLIRNLFGWLDVDTAFLPKNIGEAANVGRTKIKAVRGFTFLHYLQTSALWGTIGNSFPKWMRTIGSRMAVTYYDKAEISMVDLESRLREIFLPQVAELESLLGRNFKLWQTLYESD